MTTEKLPIISFSCNWNNKLDCKAFTTIRLHQPTKYIVGQSYEIHLKAPFCVAEIVSIKQFKLSQMNEFMAMIDTGYSVQETIEIIKKMYPKIDYENQLFDFILLQKQKI